MFIAGLEENLFPSFMSINSRADLEEERRLFYVAVTPVSYTHLDVYKRQIQLLLMVSLKSFENKQVKAE